MSDKDLVEISQTGTRDLLLLADKDPLRAEKITNSLPFSQRMSLVLNASGKDREHLILMARDAEKIVKSLPAEEFYYTIKEIGEKDASALLSLASAEQVTFCLDIEGWKKDRLNHKKFLDWWEIFLECGDDKILELIRDMDKDLIISFLKGQIKVVKPGTEIELVEIDKDMFTLDNQYYINFKNPRHSRRILTHMLELIFDKHHDLYVGILEGVIWSIPTEIEDMAFHWRQSRLLDKGFPDLYESLDIYRYLDPAMLNVDGGTKDSHEPDEGMQKWDEITPNFYLAPQVSGDFFSQALRLALEREEMASLKGELVYLCNKAMVADGVDVSHLQTVRETLANVYHYLNLGLSFLCHGDLNKAVRGLKKLYLKQIFQAGYSLTLRLRRTAEQILRDGWFPEGRNDLTLLDSLYLETMEGVLRTKPVFFEGLIDPARASYRTFRELEEIHRTEECLKDIEFLLRLHRDVYGFSPEDVRKTNLQGCYPDHWHEVAFSTVTLVSLANHVLQDKLRFMPLSRDDVQRFLLRTLEEDGKGGVLPKFKENFIHEAQRFLEQLMTSYPQEDRDRAWSFWQRCLEKLRTEFAYLDLSKPIDPRFTTGLVMRTE